MLRKLFLSLLICGSLSLKAQDILELKLDGTEQGKSLATVLSEIEKKSNARFYFLSEWIQPITFQESFAGETLGAALESLFLGTDLSYVSMYPHAVILVKDPTQALLRKSAINSAVRQKKKVEQRIFGEAGKSKKGKVIITGKVIDSKTGDPMPRTNIQVSDTQGGTTTDENGNYTLSLSPGVHVLNFTFVDYEEKVIDLAAFTDGVVDVELAVMPVMLEEIVIRDLAAREITTSKIGLTQLSIKDIKRSPSFLGEPDMIKSIQALPGVTTAGEAATGFNVRGGSVDQNLILYDGMPVFNSSHVFGFFSAFNAEAVRDVSFYRGGIPAEYGGRASSVLDIRSKDGDYEKWGGSGGIGMITSNFTINGPLQKKKTSMMASMRSTYSNWLVNSVKTDYADLSKSSVFFYDGTIKLTHLFSGQTKLAVTGYSSRDAFRLTGDSTYSWNNLQLSARLDHQISPKLGSDFVFGVSQYGYTVENADYLTASELSYKITTWVGKAGFNLQQNNHKINFGLNVSYYRFQPGNLKPTSNVSNAKDLSLDKQFSIENALYAGDEWAYNDRISIEAGLRVPIFLSFGPASVNVYKSDVPRETSSIIDTLHYDGGQPVKTYFGLEPRLSFRWTATPTSSIKLGYNRMYQFLQLVTNTTAVTPVDIWQPSGYYFKPQRADQISLGYFKDFKEKKYTASVEGFYKEIDNILDFKDGAQLILNNHLETDLLQGKGMSYGVETSFTKSTGRLTYSINYTYSRSFRTIAGSTSSETINSGKQYPTNFDQPHIINLSWKYNLSRRVFFTGNFTYHTGRPVTVPLSAFPLENTTVAYFSERNQYRIPDYHRLDLALVIEGNHKRKKKFEGTWVFSLYNAYGRRNPYTVFFKSSGNGIPQPYQLSIIGTALPSISYNFKF
ncbi:MAG: TonB-dependent receptor [Cyclobacteriaceae bacterium]|nr:TonB-dependent receptor [Cyclobacteriaceae bacterium]